MKSGAGLIQSMHGRLSPSLTVLRRPIVASLTSFGKLTALGDARFSSSVPPGYKDRWKRDQTQGIHQSGHAASTNGNQYGDLVFWTEVLDHARKMDAKSIFVITNDRKNDWYLGGKATTTTDALLRALKKDWKPIPRPHPLLVTEARVLARVGQVELLDSVYLATILHETLGNDVLALADVAIVPDTSLLEQKSSESADSDVLTQALDEPQARKDDREEDHFISESTLVRNTRNHFRLALLASRNEVNAEFEEILEGWSKEVSAGGKLKDIIAPDTFAGHDEKMLAIFARDLHDRAISSVPGYSELTADLIALIDFFPINIAASLYLGLLTSMYLSRATNASRLPPTSPVAASLFERQARNYAVNAVHAVAQRVQDNERAPLYVPSISLPEVEFDMAIDPDSAVRDEVRSMTVSDVELLIPAQGDEALRLATLFGESAPGQTIIQKACELYAVPFTQVRQGTWLDVYYTFSSTRGFRPVGEVAVPKEDNDG